MGVKIDLGSNLSPGSIGKVYPMAYDLWILGSSLGAIRKYTLLLPKFDQEEIMDVLKYEITYKVGNDIPINPEWIKDQIRAAVDKLQAEIDKKNLHGQHVLEFKCNQRL